jgi:trimeric autotransporter adhesin
VAHSSTATCAGSTVYAGSNSSVVATTASGSLAPTTLTLAFSPNPPVAGSSASIIATIRTTGTATPTGTIYLYYDDPPGGLPVGVVTVTGKTVTVATGTGSTFLTNLYNAIYTGDSNYTASTSQNLAASATQVSTTLTAAVASTSVAAGGTDVLTATIAPASTLSTAPTGTITFSSAQGTLCSGTVSSTTFSCTATLTTTGTQTITASYTGDTNYLASTSTNAPTVTVGSTTSGTGVLTVSASPSASVMYGNTVTLSSTLTSTVTGGPAGTVTFTLSGTAAATYTAALVSNGSTAGTATYAIPTPVPGTYVITATCTSSNVTCTSLSATASLTVIKGNTTTTVTASPTNPLAGQTTVFTATVAPASSSVNAAATAPTGTVTFYINGTATAEPLNGTTATFSTVLTATTGNYVTAVYSGDTNWNGSTSSQLIVNLAPIATTSSLSANQTTALYTANIILTDYVDAPATTTNPSPASPGGYVTFYDLYNGQTVLLGNANLTALIPGQAVAQISTTGLMKGTHTITALFNANTTFASSTGTIVINITDYGITLSPTYLDLNPGTGGAAIATITAYNGFGGQVVLGCVPPAGEGMTCTFTPAAIDIAGTSVLSITTTAPTAKAIRPAMPGKAATEITLAGVTLGTLLLGLLLPRSRRRPTLLVALLAAMVLGLSAGCTTQGIVNTPGNPTGGGTGGTPAGTQLISITTQGTDGVTTVRHDLQFPVTVQ